MSQDLPQADFDNLRKWAPLVSIDLIVLDSKGRVLLGKRKNEPAKGTWFVPGGRVRKDESLDDAFARIVVGEVDQIGISSNRGCSQFVGVCEHLYPLESMQSARSSIHYVVLAHRVVASTVDKEPSNKDQHVLWKWFEVDDVLADASVHPNTKAYFMSKKMSSEQYQIVAEQRSHFNELLWQTPVLSLTAQAFLFTIAFAKDTPPLYRLPSAVLVGLVSLASIQLLCKHRANEEKCSKYLEEYERDSGLKDIHSRAQLTRDLKSFARFKSHFWWTLLLWLFFAAGVWAVGLCIWECTSGCDSPPTKKESSLEQLMASPSTVVGTCPPASKVTSHIWDNDPPPAGPD